MAQDFYAAFNVGMDDKHISMVDADGVALAAIQGLNQKLNEKGTEIQELKARLERLENLMNQKNGGAKRHHSLVKTTRSIQRPAFAHFWLSAWVASRALR